MLWGLLRALVCLIVKLVCAVEFFYNSSFYASAGPRKPPTFSSHPYYLNRCSQPLRHPLYIYYFIS